MKMVSIIDIRSSVSRISDEELRHICIQIVDSVSERLARSSEGNWTFNTFSKWVGRDPADRSLQMSIQLLTSQEDAKLLDMHFYFFNPDYSEDASETIDDEEVASAYETGFLVDPITGDEVRNFEEMLVPYFVPSAELRLP